MSRTYLAAFVFQCAMAGPICAAEPLPPHRNTAPGVEYTGSKACAGCHKAVYDKFIRTSMGRSITQAAPAGFLLPSGAELASLNRHFEVFEKDGRILQSETE